MRAYSEDWAANSLISLQSLKAVATISSRFNNADVGDSQASGNQGGHLDRPDCPDLIDRTHSTALQDIKTLVGHGFLLRNIGNYENALKKFDQAIAQDARNPNFFLYRAQTLMQMKAYEAAIKDFRTVLQLDPTNVRAWHGQGVAKAELALYPSAIDSFNQALAGDPRDDKVWYNRGRALLKLEQYERALESFDNSVSLNRDKYHTWYNRALAQAALERTQPAISSLEKVTELKANCHYAWNYRGTLLNRLFKHQDALESFWKSLQYQVPNPNAWYGLASTYALLDNPESAAIHLRQAIQRNPIIYSLMARNDRNFDTVRNHPKICSILHD